MARMGFIQDKLEIKFLLLYIASRLIEPVPFEAMQELAMIDDGVDFFDFSECMNDLVTSGHLTLSEDGLYAITEKGLRNGQIWVVTLWASAWRVGVAITACRTRSSARCSSRRHAGFGRWCWRRAWRRRASASRTSRA